jgi:rhodanese-related sulfurtransferase/DNA-binding transcriptional ArsR family regulator
MTTTPRQYKSAAYEQIARLGRSLASAPRLELLEILGQGPRSVEALATEAGIPVANTSHHLQVLRRARLVEANKRGVHVTYRIADDRVASFLRALRELAEARLIEIAAMTRDFLEERGSLEPVNRDALVDRVRSGAVTVLDVRPESEYRAGHIPGAISVPLVDLERRLAEIPRQREVVAYCRGPYCVMALEAVDILRASGFSATRMEEGVLDWRARGLPLDVPAEEGSP